MLLRFLSRAVTWVGSTSQGGSGPGGPVRTGQGALGSGRVVLNLPGKHPFSQTPQHPAALWQHTYVRTERGV